MSTYTDLHLRKKENLTILRMPGNPYDGMTPQRVIFANPENIYNGKFVGELSTTSVSFNNVQLDDCLIIGGVLSNVAFKFGNGEELDLATLTSNISQLEQNVDDLQSFQTSAETSCQQFSDNIDELSLSTSWLSGYSDDLSNAISALSDYAYNLSNELSGSISSSLNTLDKLCSLISSLSDEHLGYVESNDKVISSLSDDLYQLSNDYKVYVESNDKSISSLSINLSGLSGEFIDYATETNNKIKTLQDQVQGGVVYKQTLKIDLLTTPTTLSSLFLINGISESTSLSIGYFYVAQADRVHQQEHYEYDGIVLEHGDWLLIKNNCYANNITSNDVDVIDAQDYDTFKLPDDNVATGNNQFNGNTTFNSTTFNAKAQFNGGIDSYGQISTISMFANDINANLLNVQLSGVKYGVSSLQDLSNSLQTQINNEQQKLISLSNELNVTSSFLSTNIKYLSSELSDYHNTLSGIDRNYDEKGDIKSDNLIVTDVLLHGGTTHEHKQYYMTFLSGTVVLKPIA